jgi:hypothetical protein
MFFHLIAGQNTSSRSFPAAAAIIPDNKNTESPPVVQSNQSEQYFNMFYRRLQLYSKNKQNYYFPKLSPGHEETPPAAVLVLAGGASFY